MPQASAQRGVLVVTAFTAVLLVTLAAPLDPRGFVSGDQGLKLMAAQAALAHPAQPLRLDVPVLAGRPSPYLDRMIVAHGDHGTVLQSPVFPLLSAPFLAAFGLRGVYLLPALAFIALVPLTFVLNRRLSPSPSVGAWAASAVLANPLFFYAFEFWEHVPAAACLAAATVLALRFPSTRRSMFAAGALAGFALLLRPEAVFYALTLGVLLVTSRRGDTLAGRAWTGYGVGVAVVVLAYALGTFLESGSVIGDHVSANLSVVGDDWMHVRATRLWLWMVGSPGIAAGLAGLAAAWALWAAGWQEPARVVGLVAALTVAAGPLAQHEPDVLWRAWPLGALVLVPRRATGMAPCAWLAGATSLAVWLTSTHDGGAQWGPRILLIAAPAFIVLAAEAVRDLASPGPARAARVLLVAAVVGLSLWSTRQAYVDLRGWKRYYASLVAAVERQTAPGDVIVTNVWWLDQICAELRPSRTFLVTASPVETTGALQLLQRHGAHSALLVWSTEDGEAGPIRTADTCFTASQSMAIPERQLVLTRAACQQ